MISRIEKENIIPPSGIRVLRKVIYGEFAMHWHDFFEIEFIVSGSGKYIIDDTEYDIKKNMLFFMTPIDFHSVSIDGEAEIINIMFSDDVCDGGVLSKIVNENKENGILFSENDARFVEGVLDELINATKADNKMYYTSLLNTLLIKISNITAYKNDLKLSYVQRAMLYVLNNFRRKISLVEVAEFVGLSSAYLSSIFPKEANVTFKEYLDNIRLDYSKKMMINSDMSVSDVCFESGFYDYANFIRKFKDRFGVSPGRYKKQYHNRSAEII